jgi:hypothetical protein
MRVRVNPMFAQIKVGDLIYLGSHPWNTGDVFGHAVVIRKGELSFEIQAIDVRSASGWAPPRRGRYGVCLTDARKIIRLA